MACQHVYQAAFSTLLDIILNSDDEIASLHFKWNVERFGLGAIKKL